MIYIILSANFFSALLGVDASWSTDFDPLRDPEELLTPSDHEWKFEEEMVRVEGA